MPFKKIEEHYQKNQRKIEDLTLLHEQQTRLFDQFCQEIDLSPEELSASMKNQEAFTKEHWEILMSQRQALDEKLNRELANIRNPLKIKKNRQSLNIPPQWLHVR